MIIFQQILPCRSEVFLIFSVRLVLVIFIIIYKWFSLHYSYSTRPSLCSGTTYSCKRYDVESISVGGFFFLVTRVIAALSSFTQQSMFRNLNRSILSEYKKKKTREFMCLVKTLWITFLIPFRDCLKVVYCDLLKFR